MIYVGIDIAKDKLDRFITNSNVVFPISTLSFPYIACRLNFGAKTI